MIQFFPQGRIFDETVLNDFPHALDQLALAKSPQHFRIDQNPIRLGKGSYHVLSIECIDSGLTSDRGVNLRCQTSRYLDEMDSPHIGGCYKAS